jgi:Fe-Mn family superoxide dismutase
MKRFFLTLLLGVLPLLADYQPKDYNHLLGMPGFSDALLKMHFQLYQGYVKNTNLLVFKLSDPALQKTYEYGALKRRFAWEFDGMRLHELYFDNLGGKDTLNTSSPLYLQIIRDFESYDAWKTDFIATGGMRGIGWAILYFDPVSGKLFNTWINEHDLGHLAGGIPIVVMDVFEHAYMPQYGLNRNAYIDAFFANIQWKVCAERYPIAK